MLIIMKIKLKMIQFLLEDETEIDPAADARIVKPPEEGEEEY